MENAVKPTAPCCTLHNMLEKGKEPFLLQENGYCGGPSSSDALHNVYGWKK